jgi:hypothetical protein
MQRHKVVDGRSIKTEKGGTISCFKVEDTEGIYIEFLTVEGHFTPLLLSKNAANCLLVLLLESRGCFS